MDSFNLATAHTDAPDEWRFGEVLDLSGDSARMRWNDTGEVDHVPLESLYPADDQIVSGRIDLGRCMFSGLCMEACNFTSFFMTNEYDGMSGFTRQDLWMDAGRTRILMATTKKAVDAELAKRASKERDKRAKKAAKAAGEAWSMDLAMYLEVGMFFLMSTIVIGGALGLIYMQRVAHSNDVFDILFHGSCRHFILMGAEFLAVIQILVYLASVMLVVLFGIMLTRRQILEEDFE